MYDAQLALANGLAATVAGATSPIDLGSGYAPNEGGQPMIAPVSIAAMESGQSGAAWTFTLQESPDGSTWSNVSPDVAATPPPCRVYCKGFVKLRYVRLAYRPTSSASVTFGSYLDPQVNR